LDSASDTNITRTKRNDGIILLLTISYSNIHSFDLNDIQYTYQVRVIDKTKFKAIQPIFTKNLDNRILWNRHGIRLIVLQTGNIGKFDFPTALLSIISGFGLLTISTVIVDVLATKILPAHETYEKYKYELTEKIKGDLIKKPKKEQDIEQIEVKI